MKVRGCRRSALIVSKRSCRVFEEWKQNRLVKSCALEPGGLFTARDFEEGVQTLDTAFTDVSMQWELLAVKVRSRSKQLF